MIPDTEQSTPRWNATLRHIYVSAGHDYWGRQGEGRMQHGISSLDEVECVAGKGLRGDRYFDVRPNAKGQVTFFDQGVVEEVRRLFKLPKLPASVFRRNLIVEGVSLAQWKNRRFIFQEVEFEGTQECTPCIWMDRAVEQGVQEYLRSNFRGGLRASGHQWNPARGRIRSQCVEQWWAHCALTVHGLRTTLTQSSFFSLKMS